MLSARTDSGRGSGARPSSGASTGASPPSTSAVTSGASRRSSPDSALSRASSGMERSSCPHRAMSTMSPAASRCAAHACSRVVLPIPASPSMTTSSNRPWLDAAFAGPHGGRVQERELLVAADEPDEGTSGAGRGRRQLTAQYGGIQGCGFRRRIGAQVIGQACPGARVSGQRGGRLAAHDIAAQQDPQRRFLVGIAFQRRGSRIAGRHPVAGLQQRSGSREPGAAGQAVDLGAPEPEPSRRAAPVGQRRALGRGRSWPLRQLRSRCPRCVCARPRRSGGLAPPSRASQYAAGNRRRGARCARGRAPIAAGSSGPRADLPAWMAATRPTARRAARPAAPGGPLPARATPAQGAPSCFRGPRTRRHRRRIRPALEPQATSLGYQTSPRSPPLPGR